jgi:hydrogenase maturation protein HypF
MAEAAIPLIMTSGNFSEEPIAKDNDEALGRLSNIADFFVLHNREIHSRYDDSVVSMVDRVPQIIRRARGYAPFPVSLPFSLRPSLACGAQLKNTFCLTKDHYAFVSQHIGDMENLETSRHFEDTLRLYTTMFRIKPEIIAVDMHPDYLSSQWGETEARLKDLPLVRVQHHHAHIASCMADNACRTPVIGIALDGTGYGPDGNIWGGEFMVADYGHFQRKAHFEYLPLAGGDAAIAKPYRIAAGYIYSLLGKPALDMALPCFAGVDRQEIELIQRQIDGRINSPLTSSCGRLFDAVSALLGVCLRVEYEGQAAVELETTAGKVVSNHLYPFSIEAKNGLKIIRIGKLFSAIIEEIRSGRPAPEIAAAFHDTIARIVAQMSLQFSEELGIKTVALSGGVFQNRRLLSRVYADLKKEGLTPMIHKQVPCNDGGISLGQALVANAQS